MRYRKLVLSQHKGKICFITIISALLTIHVIWGLAATSSTSTIMATDVSRLESAQSVKPRKKSVESADVFVHNIKDKKFILTKFGLVPAEPDESVKTVDANEVDLFKKNFFMDFFQHDGSATDNYPILNRYNVTKTAEESVPPDKEWKPICPVIPPNLKGVVPLPDDLNPPTLAEIAEANPQVLAGGRFAPENCQSRSQVAIIIPLRGRESQLRLLLSHMHPLWQKQLVDYTVYTVTQESNGQLFNKAKLMNVGFLEANKDRKYDCYVFHDVDMLLEDDRCLYHCPGSHDPREISVYVDKFEYKEKSYPIHCPPKSFGFNRAVHYFGGVSMVSEKMFNDVNGFSNFFWGWGGEDDDMYLRLWNKGYSLHNVFGQMCSFHMLKHETEKSNSHNEGRYSMLTYSTARMKYEGLNTLRYKLLSIEKEPLYTNITVDVGQPTEKLTDFMTKHRASWVERCYPQMPWV